MGKQVLGIVVVAVIVPAILFGGLFLVLRSGEFKPLVRPPGIGFFESRAAYDNRKRREKLQEEMWRAVIARPKEKDGKQDG